MNSPSSPAKPMAEMTPGSFVPFEGGPAQHFEREPDSPFEDGYSLEQERQHVRHLIEADDPDPSDPMWWRFAEFQKREAQLRQMQAEYDSMNAAPPGVTQQEASKLRDMGDLVDDDDDQMTLHTKEGYRMFLGRRHDPAKRLPAIPGGRALAATDVRLITRAASERVIRLAFELAKKRNGAPKDGKRRVTVLVKNNVLEGCRLFDEVFGEVGREYPEIDKDVAIVDAFTQWLIGQPEYYDVVVTTNMFGDIVTDLASVLQGGMGLAVGCNVGDEHGMFEPIHGSAPKHAGQDKANPMAMILATGEALKWLGDRKDDADLVKAGDAVESAVRAVLAEGKTLTYDLVGTERAAKMSAVTDAVLTQLS